MHSIPYLIVSSVTSERSSERSERRRGGGIKVIGPKSKQTQPKASKSPVYPDSMQYMMPMSPYGVPYMQGPYDQTNYRYQTPVMMHPQYGMPYPYTNYFPPVPEETGLENMAHKHGNKSDKKQRRRHKSKETTHKSTDKAPEDSKVPHGFDDFALY